MNQILLIIVLAPICAAAIATIYTLLTNKNLPPEDRPNDTWLTGTDVSVELVKHGFHIHQRKVNPANWNKTEPARCGMWKSELDAILQEADTVNTTEGKRAIIDLRLRMRGAL